LIVIFLRGLVVGISIKNEAVLKQSFMAASFFMERNRVKLFICSIIRCTCLYFQKGSLAAFRLLFLFV